MVCIKLFWKHSRERLLEDVFSQNIETMIISLKPECLNPVLLGQMLTPALANKIQSQGVCPTGENGEFHTLVLMLPAFVIL